ncbi:MOT13 protein, partial [Bucco capensis]|nr:MOT13 protein [Bucco capensis]
AVLSRAGPLSSALSSQLGSRAVAMAGGFLAGMGLLLAAFSRHLAHIYLSLGLLAGGLGWALVFTPSLAAVGCWFPGRRALAMALAVSGASVSSLALGPILPLLLDSYGWRGSLLLLAAISFNLIAAGALLRPLPTAENQSVALPQQRAPRLVDLLRHRPFLLYAAAFLLVDAGYYVPFVHGEARAHELGCDEQQAGFLLAAMAALDGIGRLAAGWLAAQPMAPRLLRQLFAWLVVSSLALLLLPVGRSFGVLLALGGFYGLGAGGVVPLQFAGVAEVVGASRLVHAIGMMQMMESVGSLLGPPLAGWLRDKTGDFTISFLTAAAFLLAGSFLLLLLPGFFSTSQASEGKETPGPRPESLEMSPCPLEP